MLQYYLLHICAPGQESRHCCTALLLHDVHLRVSPFFPSSGARSALMAAYLYNYMYKGLVTHGTRSHFCTWIHGSSRHWVQHRCHFIIPQTMDSAVPSQVRWMAASSDSCTLAGDGPRLLRAGGRPPDSEFGACQLLRDDHGRASVQGGLAARHAGLPIRQRHEDYQLVLQPAAHMFSSKQVSCVCHDLIKEFNHLFRWLFSPSLVELLTLPCNWEACYIGLQWAWITSLLVVSDRLAKMAWPVVNAYF